VDDIVTTRGSANGTPREYGARTERTKAFTEWILAWEMGTDRRPVLTAL
jgi:hypothetical protein